MIIDMLTAQQVKDRLDADKITKLLCEGLHSEAPLHDDQGNLMFSTVCHNDVIDASVSHKLYYYEKNQTFMCYTHCGSMDVFGLVQEAKHLDDFRAAFLWVVHFFGWDSELGGFSEQTELATDEDWDILQRIADCEAEPVPTATEIRVFPDTILDYFGEPCAPLEWIKDGISAEAAIKFGIRMEGATKRIIIPHRDINGKLIGIRARSYDPVDLDMKRKYSPVEVQGEMFNHPLGQNLYGLYENKETIRGLGKVLICESEKSVLQCATMYGLDNNFCVATCGQNLTDAQIAMLLKLGVNEIILGYDHDVILGKNPDGSKNKDTIAFEDKLLRIIRPASKFFNTYVLIDYDNILGKKASPTDEGREKFEKLLASKIYIPPYGSYEGEK